MLDRRLFCISAYFWWLFLIVVPLHPENNTEMKKQTIAIHTPYVRPDAYGSLAVPVYNNVSFEFDDAQTMSDAFCNRIKAPDYARIANPTVTQFEQRVKALTEAEHVTAFNSGMAAISTALLAVVAQGKNIVT